MAYRILVADDEAHILHVVSMKLVRAGYEVITARDGEEAFEACLDVRPDLLITDYQMPVLDGLGLCRKLRSHNPRIEVPVMLLTARGNDIERDELRELGIVALMDKPFSPREVHLRAQEIITQTKACDSSTAVSA
jgi:two-component system alkaline phosphatase synthesis response regulator PhoP